MTLNASLFRSPHALVAALLVAGALAWIVLVGVAPGRVDANSDRLFLLVSGWAAFALFLVVYAYALRKYAHKTGLSPEFRMRVPDAAVERAITRLNDLRRKIVVGVIETPADALELGRHVLRDEGLAKVMRVRTVAGPEGGPSFLLLDESTEPLGRMAKWMHAHLFYGLAAAVLVYLHGGGRFSSPMGIVLNGLSALVIATGLVGIVFWAFGPTWLTRRERDLSIEQAFGLCRSLDDKVNFALEGLDEDARAVLTDLRAHQRSSDFDARAEAALEALTRGKPESKAQYASLLALVGQSRCVAQELRDLSRIRAWINGWRYVHVPASIVLGGAVLAHVVSVWWY